MMSGNLIQRKERGQVMLMGVMAMILLTVVLFILFDVQNLFRSKIKSQTAVDAASVAGANWQMHTLNAVGELNLLKASSLLLESDLFGIRSDSASFGKVYGENDQERYERQEQMKTAENGPLAKVKNASDTLSQMQYRVLFILPLLGVGAAQQAAKNNGLAASVNLNKRVKQYLESLDGRDPDLDLYADFKEEEFCLRTMYGFSWNEPYSGLLWQILQQGSIGTAAARSGGFAVLPNMVFLGCPTVQSSSTPDFSPYLGNKDWYTYIDSNNYAALYESWLLRESCGSPVWWGKVTSILKDTDFACESEMLPNRVQVRSVSGEDYRSASWNRLDLSTLPEALGEQRYHISTHDVQDPYTKKGNGYQRNSSDEDDRISLLPSLSWAVFKDKWADYDSETTAYCRQFLRGSFLPEARYASGAVARMDACVPSRSMTGYLGSNSGTSSSSFGHLFSSGKNFSESSQRINEYQGRLREDSSTTFTATALAKPFGAIPVKNESPMTPQSLKIVLPVFTRSSLMPVFVEDPGSNPLIDWDWYRFLLLYIPELGKVSNLDDIPQELRTRFASYHALLKKFSTLDLNPWLDTPRPDMTEIYEEITGIKERIPTNRDLIDLKIPPKLKAVIFPGLPGGRSQVSGSGSGFSDKPTRKH